MNKELQGGVTFDPRELPASEYLPNRGVFLTGMLGKARGDKFGLYYGTMQPGAEIAREIHPETSETVYVLSGKAIGVVGEHEVPLEAGQVLHVDKNTHHGLKNIGSTPLEFLVIGHPDF